MTGAVAAGRKAPGAARRSAAFKSAACKSAARKGAACAALAALLAPALLSCQNPLQRGAEGGGCGQTGSLLVFVGRPQEARSILPDHCMSGFDRLALAFEPSPPGGFAPLPVILTRGADGSWAGEAGEPWGSGVAPGGEVRLPAGSWRVTALAQIRAGGDYDDAARGELYVVVAAGVSASAAVELRPIPGSGYGSFHWDISHPPNVSIAGMVIERLGGGASAFCGQHYFDGLVGDTPGAATAANPGSFASMPAGEYRVAFRLRLDDGREARRSAVLRVYQNRESRFEHPGDERAAFLDGHFLHPALLDLILGAWDPGAAGGEGAWDFAARGISAGHFEFEGIRGLYGAAGNGAPEWAAAVSWLDRLAGGGAVPLPGDDLEEARAWLRAIADAALLGLASDAPAFAELSFESRDAAESALRSLLNPLPNGSALGDIDWLPGDIAFATVAGPGPGAPEFRAEICFSGRIMVGGYRPAQGATLAEQLAWLREHAAQSGGRYAAIAQDCEALTPAQAALPVGRTDLRILLRSSDPAVPREISLSGNGGLFTVPSGATLALGAGAALAGRAGNTSAMVVVSAGALEMLDGSAIRGNHNNGVGGGVFISGGEFRMEGGEISGNSAGQYGGGVFVAGGAFRMLGGEIAGNTAGSGGGVRIVAGGEFEMRGGEIAGNTATGSGGGVSIDSGGEFDMRGGIISGNSAGSSGGGVLIAGTPGGPPPATFSMRGGIISGNSATVSGGGVQNLGGFFRVSDGAIFGSDARPYEHPNTAGSNAALSSGGSDEYGAFDGSGGAFVPAGDLPVGSRTIEVRDGALIRPVEIPPSNEITIAGSIAGGFIATDGSGAPVAGGATPAQPYQAQFSAMIGAIMAHAGGDDVAVQFGSGYPDVLDIGALYAAFVCAGGDWGEIALSGAVTSANAAAARGTVVLDGAIAAMRDANARIENTAAGAADNGSALHIIGAGMASISGGAVSATAGIAVRNAGSGEVRISGGRVYAATGMAVQIAGTGAVCISGSAYVTSANALALNGGTIAIAAGGRASVAGGTVSNTVPAGPSGADGRAINSAGEVSVSGGMVSAAAGQAIRSTGGGEARISGSAYVTSASATAPGGTIANAGFGALTIAGGTVRNTAAGAYARTVNNAGIGEVFITGGRVYATAGRAVHNAGAGEVRISGSAYLTSANASTDGGTIASSGGRVYIAGGEVGNTSATGNAVRLDGSGFAFLSGGSGGGTVTGSQRFSLGSDTAIAVEWEPTGAPHYYAGSSAGLTAHGAGGSAVWAISGGDPGISFARGANEGFAAVPGATVIPPGDAGITITLAQFRAMAPIALEPIPFGGQRPVSVERPEDFDSIEWFIGASPAPAASVSNGGATLTIGPDIHQNVPLAWRHATVVVRLRGSGAVYSQHIDFSVQPPP